MAIVFRCPVCSGEHESRLLALRQRYFIEVVSQLGEVGERCPETGCWVTVTYGDMEWREEVKAGVGWV